MIDQLQNVYKLLNDSLVEQSTAGNNGKNVIRCTYTHSHSLTCLFTQKSPRLGLGEHNKP